MDINQLKCFLAVVREKNFTRAAKSCNMTQPSLSYQISRLEEELGESLFVRKPRTVELKDSGKILLESALVIVEEQKRALLRFTQREALKEGEIRFGIIPTMAPYLLPNLLNVFHQSYPGIRILVRESQTSRLLKEVVNGDLEFAIVSDVQSALLKKSSLHLSILFRETLLMAAPSVHPMCSQSRLTPKSINTQELIMLSEGHCLRDQTMKLCSSDTIKNPLVCEQLPTQLSMVGAGLGTAIIPEMAVKFTNPHGVSFLHFQDPQPTRIIGLLKKRGRKLSIAATEFVTQLKQFTETLL